MSSISKVDSLCRKYSKEYSIYTLMVIMLIMIQMSCNMIVPITLKSQYLIAPVSALFFMLSFTISDIMTENFGFERAVKATVYSCVAQMLFCLIIGVTLFLLPTDFHGEENKRSYMYIFSFVNVIVISSIISSLVSKALNDYLMDRMRRIFLKHSFWWRTIISTLVHSHLPVIPHHFWRFKMLDGDPCF